MSDIKGQGFMGPVFEIVKDNFIKWKRKKPPYANVVIKLQATTAVGQKVYSGNNEEWMVTGFHRTGLTGFGAGHIACYLKPSGVMRALQVGEIFYQILSED